MILIARLVALAGWLGLMVAAGDLLGWGRGWFNFLIFAHSLAAFMFGVCFVATPKIELKRIEPDGDDWPPSIRLDDVNRPRKPRAYLEGFESWDK
jgi:hypothetical protein